MKTLGPELSRHLLDATIYGSLTIIIVIVFAPIVRYWLGARAAHILWLIVLLRLLLPWSPSWEIPRLPLDMPAIIAPVGSPSNAHASTFFTEAHVSAPSPIGPVAQPASTLDWAISIWALGSATMLIFLLVRVLRASHLIRRASDITRHPHIQRALLDTDSHRLRVRETRELQSPALCGLFYPTILLPTGWSDRMSTVELHHTLTHEFGHLRRGDLWWRWAFQIARALHWFNPLVWLAEQIFRTDQEMACDEWVLSHHRQTSATQYGETLLVTSHRLSRSAINSPVHAGMAETKAGLARRIRQIARFRPHGWRAILTSLALAAIIWLAFGPSRTNAEPPTSSDTQTQTALQPAEPPWPHIKPKYTQIEIKSKFVALPSDLTAKLLGPDLRSIISSEEYDHIIQNVAQAKECDLLSAPTVTTKSGQKAVVKIVREFSYPTSYSSAYGKSETLVPSEFQIRNIGVTLEIAATVAPDGQITCVLNPQVVGFFGFLNYGAGYPAKEDSSKDALSSALHNSGKSAQTINQPIFETRSISTSAVLRSGQTVVLGNMGEGTGKIMDSLKFPTAAAQDEVHPVNKALRSENPQSLALYAFITLRAKDSNGNPPTPETEVEVPILPSPAAANTGSGLPLGTAVPGKPGYVTSPFAPTSRYVDLRGFPAGAEVKCPYTGRLFLVP